MRALVSKNIAGALMAENSTFLRLNQLEAEHILHWSYFQEQNNREDGEPTSITPEEMKLTKLVRACVRKMREDSRQLAMRLSPRYCYIVFKWYGNIPSCISDDSDADIQVALGNFLSECDHEDFR